MSTQVSPANPPAAPATVPATPARRPLDSRVIAGALILLALLAGYFIGREVERRNRYDTYWLLGATLAQDFEGVYLDHVYPNGPAGMAGLEPGDRIGAIDGRPVTRAAQARRLVAERNPGDTIQITYRRDGYSNQVGVLLGFLIVVYPEPEPVVVEPVWPTDPPPPPITGTSQEGLLGVYYRMVEPGDPFSIDHGALIITSWPGGPAEQADLEAGDIILEVDGSSLSRYRSLEDALAGYSGGETIRLRVLKAGGDTVTIRVRLAG